MLITPSRSTRWPTLAAVLALVVAPLAAQAQSLKDLTGAVGAVTGGGRGIPSVEQASPSNLTGVLEYCLKNKYLGGGSEATGSSLLGKLTGSGKASDASAYKAGSGGMLETGGGDSFSLGGSGIQEKVTEQVCDLVLEHARSLL
ncbi:MAG: DUF2501 domain-containing protein [Geminicoccaceae bacterium]